MTTVVAAGRQCCRTHFDDPIRMAYAGHADNMDPYTLAYFAGHSDFGSTRRYEHPNKESSRAAMERAGVAGGGDNSGHTPDSTNSAQCAREALLQ